MNWDWEKLKEHQKYQGDGGGMRPPQMDEMLNKIKQVKLPGGPIVILAALVIFFAMSAVFTVDTDEVGVIQRFGRFVRTVQPGLNFKWPAGIEKVLIDPATGLLAWDDMEKPVEEIFIEGTAPLEKALPPEVVSLDSFMVDQANEQADTDSGNLDTGETDSGL